MNKVAYKSILCFLLIIVSLIFCGCSQVNYVNYTDEDGVYTEVVEITLDETKFTNVEQVKKDISNQVDITLETKHNAYLSKVGTKIEEYRYDPENQDLFKAYNDLLDDITWQTSDEDNYYQVKIMFNSTSSYLIFYDLTKKNFSNKSVKEGLFYDTITFTGNLGYYVQNSLYPTLRYSPYLEKYFNIFSEEDVDLTYTYLTSSKRYKSDADRVNYAGDGYYAHSWVVNSENIEKEIHFSVRIANRWIWYVVAIGISLIFALILVIIAIVINIPKRKKDNEKIL